MHLKSRPIRRRSAVLLMLLVTMLAGSSINSNAQPSPGDTARFLEQSTFGPNQGLITHVQATGFSGFLDEQFALPASSYPDLPLQPTTIPVSCTGTCVRDNYTMYPLQVTFFRNALLAPDQLRQRVTFALQQIFVASGLTLNQPSWMTYYLQTFDKNAFGNFRTLMGDITLNPGMGKYLDMAGNGKNAPNENYSREILQLFTIGLNVLRPDGTLAPDSRGLPIPTYTQATVSAFARVFTGWNLAPSQVNGVPDYKNPMTLTPANHDGAAKTLLNGVTLSATNPVTAATASKDLNDALDNIFQHQNIGPFIGRNLIQHLVTSNPTPAYVGRVSGAFNNNGSGVRGDMKAVIRAILLDPEARGAASGANFGHLEEPVLFVARFLRAFDTNAATTDFVLADSYLPTEIRMGQDLFRPSSVFNYYPPTFDVFGANVNGPEFAIQSTSTSFGRVNFVAETIYKRMSTSTDRPTGTWLELTPFTQLANSPYKLINALESLLTHGTMSPNMRAALNNALGSMGTATPLAKVQRAVYLIASSPEYFVQR
jgi:uncharacterized protein (DUF1800 family)